MNFTSSSQTYRAVMHFCHILAICLVGCNTLMGQIYQFHDSPDHQAEQLPLDIPFSYENGFIIVEVKLHHVLPLRFVFDTGAEYTILTDKTLLSLFNLEPDRTFTLLGADMQTYLYADLFRGIHLQVGSYAFPGRDILVTHEDYFQFQQHTGSQVHGILGADILQRYVVSIDYKRNRIKLLPSGYSIKAQSRYEIPMSVVRNRPYIQVAAAIGRDAAHQQLKLLLDSGAALGLLLMSGRDSFIVIPENARESVLGIGLGGAILGAQGRLPMLSIGATEFSDVPVSFQYVAEYRDTTFLQGRQGLLGNAILERFKVILDFPGGRAFFIPNRRSNKPFPVNRSGLFVIVSGLELDRYIISSVASDSPGEAAGLRAGDEILAIGWLNKSWLSLTLINRYFQKKKGTSLRIRYRRGQEKNTTHLILGDY